MGLFNFFRNEFIDIIEWVEQSNDIVMWKYPDEGKDIKYGAQLTVRDSQHALFLNEGQIADLYSPGRHELVTENMPILTTLKSWKYGFNSPFKADIYFFSTRQFTDLKWGTPNPVMMRDPQFKQVRIQAFGIYFLKIKDPVLFFKEFSGTGAILRISEIEERLRLVVSSKFAEALAEAQISVLDMAANYSELGAKLLPLLQDDFTPFGIELTKFQIASVTLPQEVQDFYDRMTNMNMVDDMQKFQQFTTINALDEAARNGGGGGLEIGAGFTIANTLMNNLNQNQNKNQNDAPNPQAEREHIMATLKQLGDLKAAGILTDDEFNQKKKELLEKL